MLAIIPTAPAHKKDLSMLIDDSRTDCNFVHMFTIYVAFAAENRGIAASTRRNRPRAVPILEAIHQLSNSTTSKMDSTIRLSWRLEVCDVKSASTGPSPAAAAIHASAWRRLPCQGTSYAAMCT